ncbi:hypothetical protein [Oscillibacter sp.]|uniref:hypothetical protein n=1 Tax=Oscillibacter sp. TaxID=1945593 RepID=UPI00289F728B|nr:hypothetical protein [Oscillibacter sp.]
MKCPKCGMDAIISESHNRVEGDKSPTDQTRLFRVLVFQCRNPQCKLRGTEIGRQELAQKLE